MSVNTQSDLETLLTVTCTGYGHTACINLSKAIIIYCNRGNILDATFLLKYLNSLIRTNYYSACQSRYADWTKAVAAICNKTDPCKESLIFMIRGNHHMVPIFKQLIDRGIKIDLVVLDTAIISSATNLVDFLVNNMVVTSTSLEYMCALNCNNDLYKKIIDNMINQKIQITSKCLVNAITLKKYSIVNLLIQYGGIVNQEVLTAACITQDVEIISRILMCRIIPTQESFRGLFKNTNTGYSGRLYNVDTKGGYVPGKQIADLVDILVKAGLVLTHEDVVFAITQRCYINDIDRFNITFKSDIWVKCAEIGYYPYNEEDIGIEPTIECMYAECGKPGNLVRLKQLISKGLIPDIECLRRASKVRNNAATLRFIIETYGIEADLECLKNAALITYCENMNLLLTHVEVVTPPVKPVVKVIPNPVIKKKVITKSSKKTEEKIVSKPVVKIPVKAIKKLTKKEIAARQKIDKKVEEKKKRMEEKTHKKKQSMTELEELANELELSDEFKKFNINKEEGEEEEEEEDEDELVEDSDDVESDTEMKLIVPAKVPKNKRIKMSIHGDIINFLKLKKGTKLSFFELRKHLTEYVMKHKLCQKEDISTDDDESKEHTIIRPNRSICTLLGLKNRNYLLFSKFDDLVSQCYK